MGILISVSVFMLFALTICNTSQETKVSFDGFSGDTIDWSEFQDLKKLKVTGYENRQIAEYVFSYNTLNEDEQEITTDTLITTNELSVVQNRLKRIPAVSKVYFENIKIVTPENDTVLYPTQGLFIIFDE